MFTKPKKNLIILLIISNLLLLSLLSLKTIETNAILPKPSNSPMQNIVIDGTINEAEWSDRDWKVEFYLNIDDAFNPPDSDGNNYMYLGEDLDNLYIGLDLCSDQTGNETDEWLGVWLNTNNRFFNTTSTWASDVDDGAESLLHDVEHDDVYPFFANNLNGIGGIDFNNDNEINPVLGIIEGNYTLFDEGGDEYFNITSVPNLGDHQIWVDFSIDVSEWFTIFGELYASAIQDIKFEWIKSRVNTTITDQKIILWYNNGTWNKDDPKQVIEINDDTGWLSESFGYGVGNLTADHKLQFSLYGNHSIPFMTQFETFEFTMWVNSSNTKNGALGEPFSSISNYQIEWDFGPSFNNASNHRMFEIKIPKNELEHYNPDGDLGIMVGGYGTMSFPQELYWVYSLFNKSIRQQKSENYYYYNMKGCSLSVPSPPTLTINTPSPTTSLDINMTWTPSTGADDYTLYRYDSLITSGNLNLATEVKTIAGTNTVDTVPAVGRWYYAVIANNGSGSSDPSNSPYIDVEAESPPNQGIPGFPPTYVYLFLLIGISVILYKKLERK